MAWAEAVLSKRWKPATRAWARALYNQEAYLMPLAWEREVIERWHGLNRYEAREAMPIASWYIDFGVLLEERGVGREGPT